MAHQAPADPTLPQNVTPAQRKAREAQLAASQATYEWTDAVPSLEGVPVVKTLPTAEMPTLEWWLKLVKILIEVAINQIEVEQSLIEQGLSALDPALVAADRVVVAAIEKDVAALEAKIAGDVTGGKGIVALATDCVHMFDAEVAIADLKNHATKLKGVIELRGATKAALGKERPRTLQTYLDNFKTISVPPIAYTFQDDLEFANLRVAGPNCMLIEAVTKIPKKCAVTAKQYAAVVPGDTLDAALEERRLFQCDYSPLSIIEPGEWDGSAKYLTCPVALFAVPPGGQSLVPVAINCDPSNAASPVMTPSMSAEKQWGWEMAKLVVQVADGNYHELFAHLARTHLVIEAIAIATHRQLPDAHPINALLVRHFEGTLFINDAAANSLIVAGGPIDHIFAGTIESSQQAAVQARLTFDFAKGMLPQDIVARGVGADSALGDYPYRDDGLLVWNAIESWAKAYVRTYYSSDKDVTGDTELQAWAAAISDSGKLKGFSAPSTIQELVDICTMTIFTASAQHASVNFPQKAIMEYAPAVTGAFWQPAPDTQKGGTKTGWLAMMPPEVLALQQLKVLFLLGSLYYRPLGTYLSPDFPYPQWFQDPQITGKGGPLSRFRAALQDVEEQIVARNSERMRPYTFLLPSLIPCSTNI